MTMNHENKETIRTMCSILSVILCTIAVFIQSYGLWYITHHQR